MNLNKNLDLKFFHVVELDDNIIDLRHRILRPKQGRSKAIFDGDFAETTMHFVAYTPKEMLVPISCVSYFLSHHNEEKVYHMDGMAVVKDFQRMGVGKNLMTFAEETIKDQAGITAFWCNARTESIGFYQKQGWTSCGEEFNILNVGLHIKMTKGIEKL